MDRVKTPPFPLVTQRREQDVHWLNPAVSRVGGAQVNRRNTGAMEVEGLREHCAKPESNQGEDGQ